MRRGWQRGWWAGGATLVWLMGSAPSVGAEALGSPANVLRKNKWTMGVGGGGVFERALEGTASPKISFFDVGHYRGFGVTDWLTLYGKIGGGGMEFKDNTGTFDLGSALGFGGGVRVRFWENRDRGWEWTGSLLLTHLRARHKQKDEADWTEGQFATSVAKRFGRVTPYLGIKASIVDFDIKLRKDGLITSQAELAEDAFIGPLAGFDIAVGEYEDVAVNVEASYINGPTVDAAIQYTF